MRETERRIKAYKALLPRMKEKVIAALSLLVVAAVMMTSTTYAWIVLSTNPEVKGLQTTIAANGNLEIALASGETISAPANSQVGDGALALVQKNITWGNLVNLGDPAYGLENIVLRPAQLNTNDLLGSPLYTAIYGADGRVEQLMSDFAYTCFDTTNGVFSPDEQFKQYGVRAVSSVTYGFSAGRDTALADAVTAANTSVGTAQSDLQLLAEDPALQSLVGLMGDYVAAQVEENLFNSEEKLIPVSSDTVEDIYYLMTELKTNMELSADALAAIYNMEMLRRSDTAYVAANKFTGTEILTGDWNAVKVKMNAKNSKGETLVRAEKLTYVQQLRTDYTTLKNDIEYMATCRNRNDIKYRNRANTNDNYLTIEDVVNRIVVTSTVTIDGTRITGINTSNYRNFMGKGKKIVIHDGILTRMDRFTGAEILSSSLTVKVSVSIINAEASGQATTSARDNPQNYVLPNENKRAIAGDTSYKGDTIQAADTYGLVLDFWVRTNAANSQLILQGSPEYETRDEAVIVYVNGEPKALYSVTYTVTADGVSDDVTTSAYLDGSDYYAYDQSSNTPGELVCTQSTVKSATPVTEPVQYIVGYNGVNRVWDDEDDFYLDDNSTTMGSGSCYVFYPKNADDQEKSLQLLRNLKVAFVDQYGTKLGEAVMDVDNVYEQTGKVTVPLVCSITNKSVTDAEGNITYYITDLEKNTATFITALLYLDGTNLSNDQVLAAGDIQGHMNIQFGATADLGAMNDPVLREEKCYVTASMEAPTAITLSDLYDITRGDKTFKGYTKTITVRVDGTEPNTVTAYFQREINSTQGIRQGRIDFTDNGDGTWTGSYDFTAAGNYILREVLLDGVSYELDQEPLTFTVEGYTIQNLSFTNGVINGKTYMTTERRFDVALSLEFASSEQQPGSIKGAFIHQETGNRTTVYFTRGVGSTWTGSASFTTSGEYCLERLEYDNEATGLTEEQILSVNLYLGLTASVYTGNTNINIDEQDTVDMTLIIRDDSGDPITNLTDVELEYRKQGSNITETGLFQKMVYDRSQRAYIGTFRLSTEGIYNYFRTNIKISGANNFLNTAAVAPTITAISPNPAVYVSRDGFGGEIFSLNNDAAFSITMQEKGAGGATLDAVLKREGDDTVYYVRGVNNNGVVTFILPAVDGSQVGIWTLQGVYMTNVNKFSDDAADNEFVQYRYDFLDADKEALRVGPDVILNATDADGKPITDGQPDYFTLEDVDAYYDSNWWYWSVEDLTTDPENPEPSTVKIINDLNIKFSSTDTVTPAETLFGQVSDFSNTVLQMEITAGSGGLPLSEYGLSVQSILTQYTYDWTPLNDHANSNSSVWYNEYGGYSVARTISGGFKGMVDGLGTLDYSEFTLNEDGKYVLTTKNKSINIAGLYTTQKVTVVIEDGNGNTITREYSKANNPNYAAPAIEVRSTKPTATIMGITPSGIKEAKITYKTDWKGTPTFTKVEIGSVNSSVSADKFSATVFSNIEIDQASGLTNGHGFYRNPSITIALANVGSATKATLTLPQVGSAPAVKFEYSSTVTSKTMSIGSVSTHKTFGIGGRHYVQKYDGYGTQTISQVVMEYNGVSCTFTLDNPLTITNPSSVNQ